MDGKYEPYTAENGIINQITCLDTLAQNEVLERNNCHILEVTHALMFSMGLPKHYWGDPYHCIIPYQQDALKCPWL